MGVTDQRHAPAALYPRERTPSAHWIEGWVSLRAGLRTEAGGKNPVCLRRGSNINRPAVQSVARHYTD
jgi:hypothetical protein